MTCQDAVLSEEYADFIIQNTVSDGELFFEETFCTQPLSEIYRTEYVPLEKLLAGRISSARDPFFLLAGMPLQQVPYYCFPKLYGLMDRSALDSSRITDVQNQPALSLTGGGVLIGFVDTGIDWRLPVFQRPTGRTRVVALWDQSELAEIHPEGFVYGREYTEDDINAALSGQGEVPLDPLGHGTLLAGIAAGSEDNVADFIGAAPNADIAVVKLKEAKQYLRTYFQIPQDVPAYQENDIMAGVIYLCKLAATRKQPLVLCLGLGSNQGSHSGAGPLQEIISRIAKLPQHIVCVAAGNEAAWGTHFYGSISETTSEETIEIRVGEGTQGFTMEFWAQSPELYSISLQSPTGELVPRRLGRSEIITFVFEQTKIAIDYALAETLSSNFLVQFRFQNPTPGIWRLKAYNSLFVFGGFHIWLPIQDFMTGEVVFLKPNPDTTLTEPSNSPWVMTLAGYQHRDNSLYLHSGRGYTSSRIYKPSLAAPAVGVYGPEPGGIYGDHTGTSLAAAQTAGACALLLEWAVIRRNSVNMNTSEAITYLVRGARRSPGREYPNREWGFGILDLYRTFEVLTTI